MASRDEILKAVRRQSVRRADLPDLRQNWTGYADPWAQFQNMVEAVGGRCVRLGSAGEVRGYLAGVPEFAAASTRVVSAVEGVASTFDMGQVDDPHDLAVVDWAIMPGEFGVAENGAIWVTDERVKHRVIYFIAQHLALVLPADQIVNNMHEAYERIAPGASSLGLFISGPSKTADIEQSLVIGRMGRDRCR